MSYADREDLKSAIAESDLIALTDDDSPDAVNDEIVTEVLADAAATIDSFCGSRYRLPLSPVPRMAKLLSVDIALFALYARRSHLEVPEAVRQKYLQAFAFLKNVQNGSASMGEGLAPAGGGDGGNAGLVKGNERLFRRKQTRWF